MNEAELEHLRTCLEEAYDATEDDDLKDALATALEVVYRDLNSYREDEEEEDMLYSLEDFLDGD